MTDNTTRNVNPPADLLPDPTQSMTTATARRGATVAAPPPPPAQTSPVIVEEPPADDITIIDEPPNNPAAKNAAKEQTTQPDPTPAVAKAPTSKTKRPKAKPQTTTTQSRARLMNVTIPQSLLTKADNDQRSRSELVRDGFTHHAQTVAQQSPKQEPTGTAGMRQRQRRRTSNEDDPFTNIRIRLYDDEIQALEEWTAKTSHNRSAFVTQLLEAELS